MAPDGTAGTKLDKATPLFVQNEDEAAIMKRSGFSDVCLLKDEGCEFNGVKLTRKYAKHGTKAPCGQPNNENCSM